MKHANDGAGVISALIRAAKGVDIRIKKTYLFTLEFVGSTKLCPMKKILIPVIAIITLAATEGFLTTLNITKEKAQMAIWDSFSYGNYAGPTSTTYHSLAIPLRVAMVKEIGSFAIAYSQTDDFKKRYSEHREGGKPKEPEPYVPLAVTRKKCMTRTQGA